MSDLMARAAAPLLEIVHNLKPADLDARTPCTDWDVRALVDHLLTWGPSLEGAARKEAVPPAETIPEDRTDALTAQLTRTVEAWSRPDAWAGTTHMGGPTELPAALVGGMVVGEMVVHGWDLARATGQHPTWDDDLLAYLYEETAKSAEQGRELGVYGSEVAVSASASLLDRTLALTGRDPAWRAPS